MLAGDRAYGHFLQIIRELHGFRSNNRDQFHVILSPARKNLIPQNIVQDSINPSHQRRIKQIPREHERNILPASLTFLAYIKSQIEARFPLDLYLASTMNISRHLDPHEHHHISQLKKVRP